MGRLKKSENFEHTRISGPRVIRPFNFLFKIDVRFWFSLFFYHRNIQKCQIKNFDFFFPFDRILRHNFYFCFNPVNNKEKNETEPQFCFSDNVAVCGMA